MSIKALYAVLFTTMIFSLWPHSIYAGGNINNADTLIIDGREEYPIYNYTTFYGNPQHLSIEQIIAKADSGYFISMGGRPLNIGFTKNYYYTKTSLHNTTSQPVTLMWLFMNPAINNMEVFRVQKDLVTSLGTAGDHYPFSHRPVHFNVITYPITLQPGERIDYYSFLDKKDENFKIGFILLEEKAFIRFAYLVYFVIGLLIGIMLLIMAFNIFLFFSLKDPVHGWYAIYVLVAILLLLAYEGMDFQFLYPNTPAIADLSRLTTSGLNLFFMLLVMRKFYSLSPQNSRYYKPVMFMQWFSLALTLCNIPVYKVWPYYMLKRVYMYCFTAMAMTCITVVILASVEKIKQGFKPAYFYLFALSFLFFGAVEYILNLFGWITTFMNQLNRILMGVVFETVIISFGILYRYNLFKREKEMLALELEVNKTQASLQLIGTQEAERKRIAQDLHDDLGGSLASIKMNVQNLRLDTNQQKPIIQLLDRASDSVRNISHNLMPPQFEATSLKTILTNHYNQLNSQGKTTFNFYCSEESLRFNKTDELMIYRIINELTNNVLKHSSATEATIQLVYYDTYLQIMAEDNGTGIKPGNIDGIGLKNIQSRVDYLGGKLNIHSNDFGTTVIIIIEYKQV